VIFHSIDKEIVVAQMDVLVNSIGIHQHQYEDGTQDGLSPETESFIAIAPDVAAYHEKVDEEKYLLFVHNDLPQ
jgi:hypothetical protein